MSQAIVSAALRRVVRSVGVAVLVLCGGVASAQGPVEGVVLGDPGVGHQRLVLPPGIAEGALCGGCGTAGCGSCGSDGCGEAGCYPGRDGCTTCEGNTRLGRLFCAFHNALCCPDPCYKPRWNDAANAAFFTDHARTVTMTRLRWDAGRNLIDPDRSDYFYGKGAFPGAPVPTRVDYNELRLYQEIGGDKFSLFIDLPYRQLTTNNRGGAGGIGDLEFGTRTMILDSELLQTTFQFKTRVPTGNPVRGVGTGSVSLEPSLINTVKLYNETYWQSQLAYWFAVGNGNGSIFHWHNSFNRVLFRPLVDTALIGTFEFVGWTFTGGRFRDAAGVLRGSNGDTYFTVGPGLRLAMCDKLDVGFGVQFAASDKHFAQRLYRTELRWRF
jgi:hypothetical protein